VSFFNGILPAMTLMHHFKNIYYLVTISSPTMQNFGFALMALFLPVLGSSGDCVNTSLLMLLVIPYVWEVQLRWCKRASPHILSKPLGGGLLRLSRSIFTNTLYCSPRFFSGVTPLLHLELLPCAHRSAHIVIFIDILNPYKLFLYVYPYPLKPTLSPFYSSLWYTHQ
jgi:hypothetical protein